MKIRWCLVAALFAVPVFAEESKPVRVEAMVAEALKNNPELKFYEAEIAAARANRRSSGAWQNPELSTTVGHKEVRERATDASNEGVAWSVAVVQPLEWPGRIPLRKAIANRDVDLAELGLARFRAALGARVRSASYSVLAAQQKQAAVREVAERFQALREVLVQRDPAGLAPLLETRVIEANEITLQRKANDAEIAMHAAVLEVKALAGIAITNPVSMSLTMAPLTFQSAPEVTTLLWLARTNNFELRQRELELAQQGFRVALARNERFPSISVGPSFSEERAGDRERIIGLGISMPVPIWNRNAAGIETAVARQTQAETAFAVAQRDLERQVAEAAARYETRRREVAKWRPDAVQHFRQAADLADRHYRLGAVPIATYVELQEKYLEALESLLDTRKEALDAAQQLQVLTGLDLPVKEAE
jgi:cobalt-zinc-cadmium efflux system outer membrane protein